MQPLLWGIVKCSSRVTTYEVLSSFAISSIVARFWNLSSSSSLASSIYDDDNILLLLLFLFYARVRWKSIRFQFDCNLIAIWFFVFVARTIKKSGGKVNRVIVILVAKKEGGINSPLSPASYRFFQIPVGGIENRLNNWLILCLKVVHLVDF